MVKVIRAVVALVVAVAGCAVHADSGNDLYRRLTMPDQQYALGYLSGVIDSMNYFDAKGYVTNGKFASTTCWPDGATMKQAMDVIKQFLDDTPQSRHLNATNLVHQAMQKAWPCPKE